MRPRFTIDALCLLAPAMAVLCASSATARPAGPRNAPLAARAVIPPDMYATAAQVQAPIQEVTQHAAGARLTRRGVLPAAPAGLRAVRLPDLPAETRLDTVELSIEGGRVRHVEMHQGGPPTPSPAAPETKAAVASFEATYAQLQRVHTQLTVLRGEHEALQAAAFTAATRADARAGAHPSRAARPAFLEARAAATASRITTLEHEAEALRLRAQTVQHALAAAKPASMPPSPIHVVAVLETEVQAPRLTLVFDVDGPPSTPVTNAARTRAGAAPFSVPPRAQPHTRAAPVPFARPSFDAWHTLREVRAHLAHSAVERAVFETQMVHLDPDTTCIRPEFADRGTVFCPTETTFTVQPHAFWHQPPGDAPWPPRPPGFVMMEAPDLVDTLYALDHVGPERGMPLLRPDRARTQHTSEVHP